MTPRLEVGDQMRKGALRGHVRLTYPRKKDGAQFPIVRFVDEHGRVKDEWPSEGWRLDLDYEGGTCPAVCVECFREFKDTVRERHDFCAQCERRSSARDREIEKSEPVSLAYQRNLMHRTKR